MSSFEVLSRKPLGSFSGTGVGLQVVVAIPLVWMVWRYYLNSASSSSSSEKGDKPKKKRGAVCPFSAETNFIVETAPNLPDTPLDTFEDWIDANSADFGKPLGARWLNAGISGQDTPGMLRAGLKRLRDSKHFLVEEPFRIKEELLMKKKALEDPKRKPVVFVWASGARTATSSP